MYYQRFSQQDFKSGLPRVHRVSPSRPNYNQLGNRGMMGAEFPEGAVRFTISPKGIEKETNYVPWIIGGILGVGALAFWAGKKSKGKRR